MFVLTANKKSVLNRIFLLQWYNLVQKLINKYLIWFKLQVHLFYTSICRIFALLTSHSMFSWRDKTNWFCILWYCKFKNKFQIFDAFLTLFFILLTCLRLFARCINFICKVSILHKSFRIYTTLILISKCKLDTCCNEQ